MTADYNMQNRKKKNAKAIKYIDLFCGIGAFRIAVEQIASELGAPARCVLSCDIDHECQRAYEANFGERPAGDVAAINAQDIPEHDLLLAGFPCQPFSIIGHRKGFKDTRGTLFFEIARILEEKKPACFVLENVKLLAGHNNGKTLRRIMAALGNLGYYADFRALNALQFGLPQKRERIFIVGYKKPCSFDWPRESLPMTPLGEILEDNVPAQYYASDHIRANRLKKHKPTKEPTIWHENKAGHISAYPYSCALRAGASYNYLLVNGQRRLTPREMLRLQGFPDSFDIVCNYSQTRKQAGNSLPVPVARAVLKSLFVSQGWHNGYVEYSCLNPEHQMIDGQKMIFDKRTRYGKKSKTKNSRKVQVPLSTK
jgi:DNA (cytosine-5)-methyltransferase 1